MAFPSVGSRTGPCVTRSGSRPATRIFALLCFFVSHCIAADVLVRYEPGENDQFEGMISDQPLSPDVVKSASISASLLAQSEAAGTSKSAVWPVAAVGPAGTSDYVSFTVEPHPTALVSLDTLSWAGTSYSDSAVSLTLRTSLDGFAMDVAAFDSVGGGLRHWIANFDLSALPTSIGTSLEFRIYPGNTGPAADWVDLTGVLGGGLGMGLTLTGTATEPSTIPLDLGATYRASAWDVPADGVFDEIVAGDIVAWNGYADLRHVAEFDLAYVPATTVSAVLSIQTGLFSAGPRAIQLLGYTGDGAVTLADFSLGEQLGAASVVSGVWSEQSFDVTSFVLDLIRNSRNWAGFNIREEPLCDAEILDCVNISVGSVTLEVTVVETVFADGFEGENPAQVPNP